MPVQTGYTDDESMIADINNPPGLNDDSVLDEADRNGTAPPPAEVASLDVLEGEDGTRDDTPAQRTITIRDRTFRLRPQIPGMLLTKLSKTQVQAQRNPNDANKQTAALAAVHDMIVQLVLEADQVDFEDYCISAEPSIDMTELVGYMATMIERITGRPTRPASGSVSG